MRLVFVRFWSLGVCVFIFVWRGFVLSWNHAAFAPLVREGTVILWGRASLGLSPGLPRDAGQIRAVVRVNRGVLSHSQATAARPTKAIIRNTFIAIFFRFSFVHGLNFFITLLRASIDSCGSGAADSGTSGPPSPSNLDKSSGSKHADATFSWSWRR